MKKIFKIIAYILIAYIVLTFFMNCICYLVVDETKEVFLPTWNILEIDNGFKPLEAVQ